MENLKEEARETLKARRIDSSFNYVVILIDEYDWYERAGFLIEREAKDYKEYLEKLYTDKKVEIIELN